LFHEPAGKTGGPDGVARLHWKVGLMLVLAVWLCTDCARFRPRFLRGRKHETPASELHTLPIAPEVDYARAIELGDDRRLYLSEHDLIYADDDHFYPIVVQGFPRLVGKSPSGRFVAFLDPFEFEMAADLYVFDVPARSLRQATDHRDAASTLSIKAAYWYDDRTIYYLEGYRYGTVSRGGDLWRVDVLTLERNPVVQVMGKGEKSEEIVEFEFVPEAKLIRYVVAQYDESSTEARIARYCTLDGKPVK